MIRQTDLIKLKKAGIKVHKISGTGSRCFVKEFVGFNRWKNLQPLSFSEAKNYHKNTDDKTILIKQQD